MEGYIADIQLCPYEYAPRYWAFCEGQLLRISQNAALFSLLGVQYGGDGKTTFALPDMRDPARPGYHKGFGPELPLKYIICMQGIYPQRP